LKRIALLTTWQENCGVAHYSYFLKRALDKQFDITVIPTQRDILLANRNKMELRKASERIDAIAAEIRKGNFDAVVMQFEPGIYGRGMKLIEDRVRRIVEATSGNFVICFHSLNREPRPTLFGIVRAIRRGIGPTIRVLASLRHDAHWERFYRTINAHAKKASLAAITHTERDARFVRGALPDAAVLDGPLCYMDESYISAIPQLAQNSKLPRLLPNPTPATRYIGCFGFYSPYKSFETAIRALDYLPDEYELLLFSGVHESTLTVGQGLDQYLSKLMDMVEEKTSSNSAAPPSVRRRPLRDKVHFVGTVSDDDMILGMKLCDAVLVPYTNSTHSGSGPASLALELDCKMFVSRTVQFVEFKRYFPNHFEFVDIGNHLEIAQKILRMANNYTERQVEGMRWIEYPKKAREINIDTNANLYARAISGELK
jgi:glycosyltransferase involved in cell wall biosynthesis